MTRRPKRRRRNSRKWAKENEHLSHLQWVRGFNCLVDNKDCQLPIEAHHVGHDTHDDRRAVPLCLFHHRWGHTTGWSTFAEAFDLNLDVFAEQFWRDSPHGKRARRLEREREREAEGSTLGAG